MPIYEVKVVVQHVYVTEVEADNETEAEGAAAGKWWDGDIDWKSPVVTALQEVMVLDAS